MPQAPKKTANIREAARAKASASIETVAGATADSAAVSAGRQPLSARRTDLAGVKAKAAEMYGIPPGGLTAVPAIDSGFIFAAAEVDGDLNYLHVEALLAQATELLAECRQEADRRQALLIEKLKFQLELDEFLRLDEIDQRERQAGSDTVRYQRAMMETSAERSIENYQRGAEDQWKALLEDLIASGFNRRMSAREAVSWISPYPLKDRDLGGDDALYSFDGARRTKPDHLFEAARVEADQAAWEQVFTLMAQRYGAMAESEAAKFRRAGLDLWAQWLRADIAFRRERGQAPRDMMWERVYQAQASGGLLNYNERIVSAERRFASAFRDAIARIAASRQGLKALFDYDPPFPQEGVAGYFEGVEGWTRQAKRRTAQFAGMDQAYSLSLSMKQLTQGQWEAGRSAGEWTFDLAEDLFKGQVNVRLRGVAMAVVGEKPPPAAAIPAPRQQAAPAPRADPQKPEGFWSGRVTPPVSGTVRYVSGAMREVDQKMTAPCILGRVEDLNSSREAEFRGGDVWHNASPIGKQWRVALSASSTAGAATQKLDDVVLILRLVARPLKAGA